LTVSLLQRFGTATMTTYSDLKGKTVLVTGGAAGIGAAIVRAFRQQGMRVFFCDVDAHRGKRLARELGGDTFFARVDLLAERQIVGWIQDVGRASKQIDVLVNNAAADPRIPLRETSAEDWDLLFARNLRAYFLAARETERFMEAGAAIINFSSITVHIAPPNMTAYVATKAGIQGFTRSLARELGPRRIRVNTLSPGWVMTERQLRDFVTPAVKRLIKRSQCIPDRIQPGDIADVALFLASDASRALTGQELLADRGWAFS
jgi:NAD(P)-dependent dehydrogenase (short-subunit alcohol dehydrogenase family)